jgi:hypothetical protein
VDSVEREGREVDQIDVAIEAAVEAEVAEVGGNAIEVGGVVTENRDGDGLVCFGGWEILDGVGDVEDELVVAAFVGADERGTDPEGGGLACALEVEEGASLGEGVGEGEVGAVPALSAEVGVVGVAGVAGVEAVGEGGGLPLVVFFSAPDLPDSVGRAFAELPAEVETAGGDGGSALESRLHRDGAEGWGEQGAGGRHGGGQEKLPSGWFEQVRPLWAKQWLQRALSITLARAAGPSNRSVTVTSVHRIQAFWEPPHSLLCTTLMASDSRFVSQSCGHSVWNVVFAGCFRFVTNVSCRGWEGRVGFGTGIDMSRTSAIRDAWRPQTQQDREAILLELKEILASPHFSNSKRYPALLQYIVENTLDGKADLLKERTLGVEVFDRPASYDTNADTVVRYTAGEVRKRLSLYYHELGRKPVIQISLPAGSYVPEFLHALDEVDEPAHAEAMRDNHAGLTHELDSTLATGLIAHAHPLAGDFEIRHEVVAGREHAARRGWWVALAAVLVVAALAGWGWRYRSGEPRTAMDNFWAPVLRDQQVVIVCTGGSVFAQNNFSGVLTAGKDTDYPFISMQSASAIAQLSGLLARSGGATTQLQSSATTPLTELREHPVILLGGYNNQWTLRLLQPLRFHFSPESIAASIVDGTQPGVKWERDHTLPYSSADDYAVVARFRDTTTDGWVIVLAGLGRNGTEAAAQFVTSAHYMQLLREQAGSDFANKNVEVILKVNVIEGKTGAPSIQAVHVW